MEDRAVAASGLGLPEGCVGGDLRIVVGHRAGAEDDATDADGGMNPAGADGVRVLSHSRAEIVGDGPDELWRRTRKRGVEFVASHAGQRLIRSKAPGEHVRDASDQRLRGARTVALDHLAVSIHVDR